MEKAFCNGISLWKRLLRCLYGKGSLQRELIMEKAPCKGIYLWKMVSVKGLKGEALSKGICFGTGVVSLWKRPLCKGS